MVELSITQAKLEFFSSLRTNEDVIKLNAEARVREATEELLKYCEQTNQANYLLSRYKGVLSPNYRKIDWELNDIFDIAYDLGTFDAGIVKRFFSHPMKERLEGISKEYNELLLGKDSFLEYIEVEEGVIEAVNILGENRGKVFPSREKHLEVLLRESSQYMNRTGEMLNLSEGNSLIILNYMQGNGNIFDFTSKNVSERDIRKRLDFLSNCFKMQAEFNLVRFSELYTIYLEMAGHVNPFEKVNEVSRDCMMFYNQNGFLEVKPEDLDLLRE